MSEENVEAVRRAYETLEDNDLDAFLAELHPGVEWHPQSSPASRASSYHRRRRRTAQRVKATVIPAMTAADTRPDA
jgi:ketosteroid isomerase-like protein